MEHPAFDELTVKLRSVEMIHGSGLSTLQQQLAVSYVLIVAVQGEGKLMVDEQIYQLTVNSVYLCMPDHTFGVNESADCMELIVFHFDVYEEAHADKTRLNRVGNRRLFSQDGELQIRPADKLVLICNHICRRWRSKDKLCLFRCQIDFLKLLYYISVNLRTPADDSHSALSHAKQYMEEYFSENMTIEALARVAGLSPKYFVDLFKKKYGMSAMDYVTRMRMDQAKQYLIRSEVKLRDIAHQVGYADEYYFSRKFKKETGVSPTRYIQSRRRKIVAYHSLITGYLLPLNITPYAAPLHPKWTEYYYRHYGSEIMIHLSAYKNRLDWSANIDLLRQVKADVLISIDEVNPEERQRLERIAPVYYLPSSETDWRRQLRMVAEALGETSEAEQWLRMYHCKVIEGRERLGRCIGSESVLLIRLTDRQMYVHSNQGMADLLFHDLLLTPAHDSESGLYNIPVTPEQLHDFDADHMLMLIRQDDQTLRTWNAIQSTEQWKSLPAVRHHRIHLISSDPWREHSAYAHLRKLEQAVLLLSGDCPK